MKTFTLRNTVLALVFAAAANAQGPAPLHADVPFNFTAGKTTLAAGRYTVEQSNAAAIAVRGANGKAVFLIVNGAGCTRTQTPPRLVFHRYGDTYRLSQVWTVGDNCGREVPPIAREREVEANAKPHDDIVVAMH